MYPLNPLLTKKIKKSLTFATGEKAAQLKKEGKDIISFGAGDPYGPFSEKISQYGANLLLDKKLEIRNRISKYAPVQGIEDLRERIADKHSVQSGVKIDSSEVTVHFGGKQAITNFMNSVISNKKDEIMILTPAFVSYLPVITLARGKAVFIKGKIEEGYKIDPKQIEKKINSKTAAIIICSPNNPTGHMYDYEELESIANLLSKYDIRVFSDEVYDVLSFAPNKFTSMLQFRNVLGDRLTVSNGISKSFAMTGLRLGWNVSSDKDLISCMNKIQSHTTSSVTTITQEMSMFALSGKVESWVEDYNKEYKEKCEIIYEELMKIPKIKVHKPQGSLYIFPQFNEYLGKSYKGQGNTIKNTTDLSLELLTHKYVAAVPGEAFYDNNLSLRLSACPKIEDIKEGVNRIREFFENLT